MRTRLKAWILNVGTHKAVRRIPINAESLTGKILGQEFESSLERDLIMIMAWKPRFEWFQVQPVKIDYTDKHGSHRTYTPDLLVYFTPFKEIKENPKPILCEVKYRKDLSQDWESLRPKFKAARAYAKKQGWEFRIYTEDRIRTVLLKNLQFLWPYQFCDLYPTHYDRLLRMLDDMEETSIHGLFQACYHPENKIGRGEGLWTLWCMVARRTILCDLSLPLSMDTTIWLRPELESDDSGDEDSDI